MTSKEISKKYEKLTEREHLLHRPGMWIGSTKIDRYPAWIYNSETEKIEYKEIEYSQGLLQIVREIITNAVDHCNSSGTKVSQIKVKFNRKNGEISVYNDGKGIDVIIHDKHKMYIPEMLFSEFASSSNYDDTKVRTTVGTNGMGAKATVVFSKVFKVKTADTKCKKEFIQTYKNNLLSKSPAEITDLGEFRGTEIKFTPDYSRFQGFDFNSEEHLTTFENLIHTDTITASLLTDASVKVSFNGKTCKIKCLKDYIKYFVDDDVPIIYEKFEKDNYKWEYAVCLSEDLYQQISFVNGLFTINGGTHVEYILKQITKKLTEGNVKYKEKDIRDNTFIFVNSTIDKPSFSEQIKSKLTTPASQFGIKVEVSQAFINKVKKSDIINAALKVAKFKEEKELSKTDGKKKKNIEYIENFEDALWAGTAKSNKCTLILTEGLSAKASVMSAMKVLGNEKFGVFPLKGKLLNVRDKSLSNITQNKEIENIKKILGLEYKKVYNSIDDLRYSKIKIITDADVDGIHIKGLIINFIDFYWPSIINLNNFVTCMATPILKATRDSKRNPESLEFYSQHDYEKWKTENDISKWKIKYYKGLGTNTKDEFISYCKRIDDLTINYVKSDKKDSEALELAFKKENADLRKEWVDNYNTDEIINYSERNVRIKKFIDNELKHFSVADNKRSIPCFVDGLKPSQRKILFSAFKRNLVNEIKVAQFAGYVSENTEYHHGEASLQGAIINLAQDYTGSNNINLLYPSGQFGTRLSNGKDHGAPRYIYTNLCSITKIIFNEYDNKLLKYLEEEGQLIEPEWYIPIIPMILVNGSEGIGTGYSTSIPCFNPNEIINYYKGKLKDEKVSSRLTPWYRGYTGKITRESPTQFISHGTYEISDNRITITEIPIGISISNFKKDIQKYVINKKDANAKQFIKDIKYTKDNDDETVGIILECADEPLDEQLGLLKLSKTINTSNIHLFNSEGKLEKYSVKKILEDFYLLRLDFYTKRREYIIKDLESKIKLLANKVRFIEEVNSRKVIISNKNKKEIEAQLESYDKIDDNYDYLTSMPIYTLSLERITELKNKLDKLNKELRDIKKKTNKDLWLDDLVILEEFDFGNKFKN